MRLVRRVVEGAGQFQSEIRIAEIGHRACERQRVHLHALRVHIRKPKLQIGEFRRKRAARESAAFEEISFRALRVFGAERFSSRPRTSSHALRVIMRMNVDPDEPLLWHGGGRSAFQRVGRGSSG